MLKGPWSSDNNDLVRDKIGDICHLVMRVCFKYHRVVIGEDEEETKAPEDSHKWQEMAYISPTSDVGEIIIRTPTPPVISTCFVSRCGRCYLLAIGMECQPGWPTGQIFPVQVGAGSADIRGCL